MYAVLSLPHQLANDISFSCSVLTEVGDIDPSMVKRDSSTLAYHLALDIKDMFKNRGEQRLSKVRGMQGSYTCNEMWQRATGDRHGTLPRISNGWLVVKDGCPRGNRNGELPLSRRGHSWEAYHPNMIGTTSRSPNSSCAC